MFYSKDFFKLLLRIYLFQKLHKNWGRSPIRFRDTAYSIDFLHFFAKRRKLVEKITHRNKNRDHRTSKIVKSTQSYSNGHFPYYCSLYYLARALDAWRVNFVRSKDAQKQLARTSLIEKNLLQSYSSIKFMVQI